MRVLISGVIAVILLSACGDNEPQSVQSTTSESVAKPQAQPQPTETAVPDQTNTDGIATDEEEASKTEAIASEEEIQAAMAALPADAGQKRYEATCKICHDQGLLEAPKKGDKAAWQARIAKGKDVLYRHSSKGFGKMPAQTTGEVSEAEVRVAVDYLVEQSS